jgi:hypothetical protein
MIDLLNAVFWILSNVLVGYIAIALVVFAIAYPILFDPRATTAGKFILRFIGSLIGVIGLVFIAVFVDPRDGGAWFEFPGDILWWRPAIRLLAYSYVAYTLTGLVVILWLRKFRPHKLVTAPNESTIPIRVRRPRR